ncbi:hypothetical protein THIOM_004591 [Candidatus Thiomargarita nelsonii]|uniref:Uncharacterized protein n=1 Tax=Candidatus Thiomargarita nelsonii TaxID=1003181 RepID=A0A176RVK9_9GAMM|nr:hypothetical protein THIOM_004591 [Candidatus Thiomargarita nelsonii]
MDELSILYLTRPQTKLICHLLNLFVISTSGRNLGAAIDSSLVRNDKSASCARVN